MSTIKLNDEETAMLNGSRGSVIKDAIKYQIEVGNFFEARKFVPINNAHVMGDIEIMGDAGLKHLRKLAQEGQTCCAVPTSTNAQCMHYESINNLPQVKSEISKEKAIEQILRSMEMATTDTCINYQTVYQPKLGEHLAWGDTGTVAYANSIFGARTNFEAGYSSFAAALTGRTPAYGFHLDEYRKGRILIDLQAKPSDLADWGAIGKLIGHTHQDYSCVPVFTWNRDAPSSDALKHLGASLASYGSMAMFHMVGITPEATTIKEAFGSNKIPKAITITDKDIIDSYKSYEYSDAGSTIVVFSGPQQSLFEMQQLAKLFDGRTVAKSMQVFITTNRAVYSDAKEIGYIDTLQKAGVIILQGVCFYILQNLSQIREMNGWANLVSNSGKLVNTITAHKFNTILRHTQDCVDIACTGTIR